MQTPRPPVSVIINTRHTVSSTLPSHHSPVLPPRPPVAIIIITPNILCPCPDSCVRVLVRSNFIYPCAQSLHPGHIDTSRKQNHKRKDNQSPDLHSFSAPSTPCLSCEPRVCCLVVDNWRRRAIVGSAIAPPRRAFGRFPVVPSGPALIVSASMRTPPPPGDSHRPTQS
ncbi:basic proline-rich protein-like [Iris pallida]|uniref:Basic proline-rich protein-like n=1 Tax=Iris pallida TaxID=29817 RepID=A0AAX6F530_IRIPA|nr:basic proline-rich protein-like [Iris pallida]